MAPMFPPSNTDRPIVLVHGAWVGEWSWLPILPQLRASGRPVYPVSLRGHGMRRSESSPAITLDDHVHDVVSLFDTLDLDGVTLVGHSYGGRVITRAFEELQERIAHLVYLDAHTPVAPDSGQVAARYEIAAQNGGMIPFADRYLPTVEMVGDQQAVEWFVERLVEHSFITLTHPWQVSLPDDLPKTFIYAEGVPDSSFTHYAEACRSSPHWKYHEISGDHFLMMSHPDQTAAIILES